jgi:peptidoglycan/LPS O-acetylase OafA/YrhL
MWYWGVMDFFFVMSGFLITRSLVSNCARGRGNSAFFLYRALRLLPCYVALLLFYELLVFTLGGRMQWETLPYLLFYQHTDMIFGSVEIFPRIEELVPYWSLVLEEHYYVLWGVLFCTFAYAKFKITPFSIGIVVLLLGLAILMRKMGVSWRTLPGRFDGFLLGSFAGMIIFMPRKVHIPENWNKWLIRTAWIVSLVSFGRLSWSCLLSYRDLPRHLDGAWIDVSCFCIVSLVLILSMVKLDMRRIHFGKPQDQLAFIGLISYEIYLVHYPIATFMRKWMNLTFDGSALVLFLVTMTLSSAIAYLMHRTLTAPALKKREPIHSFFSGRYRSLRAAITVPSNQSMPVPVVDDESKTQEANRDH